MVNDANVLLSVIIPVYNEPETVKDLLDRVCQSSGPDWEIIVVDDGSASRCVEPLKHACNCRGIRFISHGSNQGKTAAVLTGLKQAVGKWVVVQDADLEYDPKDLQKLLVKATSEAGGRTVVFGRRPSYWGKPQRWFFAGGVLGVDLMLAAIYKRFVRDHATCYKMMNRSLMNQLDLQSSGFEGCIEITCKLARMKIPIQQIPISYVPRSSGEGKKLGPRYAFAAFASVLRWRRWSPPSVGQPTLRSAGMNTVVPDTVEGTEP